MKVNISIFFHDFNDVSLSHMKTDQDRFYRNSPWVKWNQGVWIAYPILPKLTGNSAAEWAHMVGQTDI